jgi:hypothetical protein
MQVAWKELAIELGSVNSYNTQLGFDAIETLLGEDFFAQAVKCCIDFEEGWLLAEGVLRILRPLGMKHCYNIYKLSRDLDKRRRAVLLLKYTSDREVLNYIPEFLADPDEQIQRSVIEILDQMLFWNAIDYEDFISILESAIDHPNEEVRKFAVGTVGEETIQEIADFTKTLEDALWNELYDWKQRFKFETIHGLDLRCVPWHGQFQLSFLTDQEDFDLSEAYSDDCYFTWRLGNLPPCGYEIEAACKWMKKEFEKEFEKSGLSLQYMEVFLEACVAAIKSPSVQDVLHEYNLSQDFQITIFSPNSSFPRKNFYSTLGKAS